MSGGIGGGGFGERFINAYAGGEAANRADTVRANAYGASQGDPTASAAVFGADPQQGATLQSLYQNKQQHELEMHDRVLQHVVGVAQQTLDAPDAATNGPQFQASLAQAKQYLSTIPGVDAQTLAGINTPDDVKRAIAMFTPHTDYIAQQRAATLFPYQLKEAQGKEARDQADADLKIAEAEAYRQLGVGAMGQPGGPGAVAPTTTPAPRSPAPATAPATLPAPPATNPAAAPSTVPTTGAAPGQTPQPATTPTSTPATAPIEQRYPPDILYAARRYRAEGTMPNLGMGVMGTLAKRQVLRAAAEMSASDGGADADVLKAAAFKADKASLQQLQRYADNVETFENTAQRAWRVVKTQLAQNPGALSNMAPYINQWIQSGRVGALGNEEVPPLAFAMMTALNETAKVTSGSLGGPLTDSARQEVGAMGTSMYQNPGQALAVIDRSILPDMENRRRGFIDQLGEIKSRIGGTQAPPQQPDVHIPTAADVRSSNAVAEPKTEAEYNALPKGTHYTKPGETQVRIKQ